MSGTPMISFCTPVKGRLEYLRQTYVHNLKAAISAGIPAEFVLLDYDSPDGLTAWAKETLRDFSGMVSLYRSTIPRPFYAIPVADNCAFRLAGGQIVSNLMADVRATARYFAEVHDLARANPNGLVRAARSAKTGTTGLMTIWKDRFIAAGGYDEEMQGWGYQDVDLRHRCEALKMNLVFWTESEADALPHGDECRTRFSSVDEAVKESNAVNIERSKRNVRKKKLVANAGRVWGQLPVERIPL